MVNATVFDVDSASYFDEPRVNDATADEATAKLLRRFPVSREEFSRTFGAPACRDDGFVQALAHDGDPIAKALTTIDGDCDEVCGESFEARMWAF